jgi:acyl-coenzyme A synthetase/AMP-(fatty) acid ligase
MTGPVQNTGTEEQPSVAPPDPVVALLGDRPVTRAALDAAVDLAVHALTTHGVEPGDRVLGRHASPLAALPLAAALERLEAVYAPVAPDLSGIRLSEAAEAVEAALVVTDTPMELTVPVLVFDPFPGETPDTPGLIVSPVEIEALLATVPGIREAALVTLPRPDGDDLLAAVLVADDPGHIPGPSAVRTACAERVAEHMRPQRVFYAAELPRTPGTGQIRRSELVSGITGART